MKKFFKSEIGIFVIVILITAIIYLFFFFRSKKQEAMMEKSSVTFGILDQVRSSNRADDEIDFHFTILNGHKIFIDNYTHDFDCSNAKIGDTITIKYSLKNSNYVELIHCYWNPDDTIQK